jgi:4-diphosphocytidyl-2-C-methyl-D-erythritol kinase
MRETAYAKVNLALHVRGRRHDGYHELETLFAFVDRGDELIARPTGQDRLKVTGEFATGIIDPAQNLVARALCALPRSQGLDVTLEKNLPVAAGLGGGSADAGAVFRIVRQLHGLPDDWHRRAAALGADVPACVDSLACIGRGTGAELAPVENDLAGAPVLLVNPREALSTKEVFSHWDGNDGGPLGTGSAREIARRGRNDLRGPALLLRPVIAQVLDHLESTGPWKSDLSGSGATCFALYETADERDEAARRLTVTKPGWWQLAGRLR